MATATTIHTRKLARVSHRNFCGAAATAAPGGLIPGELLFIHATRESCCGGYIATASRTYPPSGDGYVWAQPLEFHISADFLEWLPVETSGD